MPLLLFHGTLDPTRLIQNSEMSYRIFKEIYKEEAEANYRYIAVDKLDHSINKFELDTINAWL